MSRDVNDQIGSYMKLAAEYPLLTRQQEADLALQIKAGKPHAKDRMFNHNLRLIIAIAKQFRRHAPSVRMDDLVQEGSIGLLKAIEKFDFRKGNKFITYAGWWVKAYIRKYISEQREIVRQPPVVAGRELDPLAKRVNLDDVFSEENDSKRLDLLIDPDEPPDVAFERRDLDSRIKAKLSRCAGLTKMERRIIDDRFAQDEPVTLETIGNRFRRSRERVRQVEKNLRPRMRRMLESVEA